jgi:hypothetical protein
VPLRDVLLASAELESHNISPERVDLALDPSRYLGGSEAFISAALHAHQLITARGRSESQHG